MALSPDIRDQAYQFFIEEAPELLQAIEAGLLTLRQERSTALVHGIMRAAHSLKGGAASVELEAIKTLAHRLENIFKALYNETIEIDSDLESQLLQAYDCLRLPLMEQIATGEFDAEQALALAEPIFAQIEERFGDALAQADNYIPSSSELGVDMALSIFEVDVQEGLERLAHVVTHPSESEVAGELRAQAEVFAGFAELLNQPGFGAIAKTTLAALDTHPDRALVIAQLALTDFQLGRQAVLAAAGKGASSGVTTKEVGPCTALAALAKSTAGKAPDFPAIPIGESIAEIEAILEHGHDECRMHDDELFCFQDTDGSQGINDRCKMHNDEQNDSSCLMPHASCDWELEETISTGTEQMDDFFAATEVLADTQSPEEDRILEEIFTLSPEDLQIFSAAAQVSEDKQSTPKDGTPEEIFTLSPEDLDTFSVAAQVSHNTQTAAEEGELEEISTISPEEVFGSLAITCETNADTDALASPETIDVEWVAAATSVTEETAAEALSLQEVVKSAVANPKTEVEKELQVSKLLAQRGVAQVESVNLPYSFGERYANGNAFGEQLSTPETLEEAVQSIGEIFDNLPPLEDLPAPASGSNLSAASQPASLVPTQPTPNEIVPFNQAASPTPPSGKEANAPSTDSRKNEAIHTPHLTVRVGSERLERMNNLVGELAINRNGLSLQNEQLQRGVRELLNRFVRVQNMVGNLQELSYQMLVAPERHNSETSSHLVSQIGDIAAREADFDSLELDRYGVLNSRLQGLLEDMVQLEESVDDIVLFARATDQTLEQQRQMLTQLRDEVIWARMLPLGEVLNRFPRLLRDLSTRYRKPVNLKLSGTSVLVDKAVLEKLYDPLLHLLRNAFDHGIESPQERRAKGKPEQGQIEIQAYHQGSQTIIEVRDDGQGLNLERIRNKALELGLLSAEQLATTSNTRLYEVIFEAGFSTAKQVSELSGRGVGLDVVRSQMRSLKGTISVTSSPGVGTTFTLRLPLTLTIAKLLVCFVGTTALAMPSDGVEEIVVPKANQVQESGSQRFLQWRGQIVPTYRLAELLEYNCPLPDTSPSKALIAVPSPQDWALPMLIVRQDQNVLALEIDRLVTEQELVIKPFGSAIAPPSFTYGCTILGDGSLIPVIDSAVLLDQLLGHPSATTTPSNLRGAIAVAQHQNFSEDALEAKPPSQESITNKNSSVSKTTASINTIKAPTVLVVDDAVALRRTLALTLERAGCQVLQARDGREAIEQLQHSSSVDLVICDIEMPNMNGFEFLSYRRQDPQISKIPVAMLTSRSNDKHRWLAMHLGATAYFTKPYLEQEFVKAIKEIIGQGTPEHTPALQPSH